ncbi:MAG: T9SS C-terminal target domain-containing protein, partial [Bacteroidetes bacterium]
PSLSGNFTINSLNPTAGTNYNSFSALISDLSSFGVCGPVTVNVAAGTYTTSITLGAITGTSATNTITIDGGDSSTTIITHNGATQYGTIILDGASYITLKNLGIISTGASNAVGLMFVNSNHCTVSYCEISVSETSITSTVMPVTYSGAANSTTSAGNNHYNILANNKLKGGYYGVRNYSSSTNYGKYNQILNNDLVNVYYYGIYSYYQDSTVISGNTVDLVSRGNVNGYGIYAYYNFNSDYIGNNIKSNDYGFYLNQVTTARPPTKKKTRIINNMVKANTDYGMYIYGVDSVDFLHNTVFAGGTTPAVYFYASTSTLYPPIDNYDIRNNIFYSSTSEAVKFLNCTDTIADKFDNNIFYTGGATLVTVGTTGYADLLAYQTANSLINAASLEGDPSFLSSTDLHVIGALANDAGDNSAGVAFDIDGDARPFPGSTTVDIGADEFSPPACIPVSNASFINPSLDSVTIFWNGVGTSFQYELLLAGSAQGSGSFHFVNSDSIRIGGLAASTQYEYYVREICGRGDTSFWVGPIRFGTAIGVPYFQDFENFASNNSGPTLDEGWITINSSPRWTTMASKGQQVSSSNTSPYYDNTNYGTVGGMFVYLETSTSAGTSDLVSPPIYIDPSYTNVLFEFAYHMYGATMGTLEVLVDTNGVQTSLWSLTGQQQTAGTDPWVTVPLNLVGYQGKSVQLIFRGTRGSSFTSDMGVDDIRLSVVAPLNAGVLEVQSPQLPICPGTITPVVGVKNFGTDTINSVDVIFVANGVHDTTSYVGQILPGDTASVTLSPTTVSNGVLYDLMFYTDMPNNMADAVPGDDTLSFHGLRTGLTGAFTIDPNIVASATNWQTFNAFAADISNYGLCGPVTVDVAPGTYNEQVEFKEITGASAINTMTINGHGANLNYASTNSNERSVLTFNKASYIILDSLNINASAGTYGHGIQNFGGAHHITIQNCTVDVGAQNTSSFFAGIVNSGSKSSATTSGGNMHHITIDNCRIIGGYYGITSYGNTANSDQHNFVITNNTIEDVYYAGVYMLYTDTALIEGNDVSRPTKTSVTTMYGYFISTGTQNAIFNANTVHNTHGAASSKTGAVYAFYVAADATVGNENYITNNIIYDINSDGTVYAIYDLGADGAQYINNTISLDHVASTGGLTRGFYQSSASTNSSFVNNIISISRGGSGVKHGIYLGLATTSMNIDYNNVYLNSAGTGATSYGFSGSDQATLANWQANTSFGANSYDVDPKYNNLPAFNLTPSSGLINSVGLPNAMVTTDYYGVTRAAIPDLGAIEFNPPLSNNLGFASLTAPIVSVDSCYGATEDVIVKLINAGGVPLDFSVDNATLTMNVTGAITQTLTVNLNNNNANGGSPLAIGTVVEINMGTINMTSPGFYNFKGIITMTTDTFPQNDTLNNTQVLLPVTGGILSGTDTICVGDTATLKASAYQGTLQWQVLNGSTWTDIAGQTSARIDVFPATNTSYRVMACGTGLSDTITVVPLIVNTPTVNSSNAIVQCGSAGTDTLIASGSPGASYSWYDANVGGNLIHSGDTLMFTGTPGGVNSPSVDTFYVSASTGAKLDTLTAVPFLGGNSCGGGNMFDLMAKKNMDIIGMAVNTTLSAGTAVPVNVYITNGTYSGKQLNSSAWTLVATGTGTSMGQGSPTEIVLSNTITLAANTLTGVFVNFSASYTNITAGTLYSSPDLDLYSGDGLCGLFTGSNPGRAFNGRLYFGGGCESARSMAIAEVNCVVGIDKVETISSFNVSPNPSTGLFKLSFATMQNEKLNMNVRDVAGKVVYKDMLHVNGNFTKELDFSNFAKGVYFLQIQSGNNSRIEKLIIK